MEDDEDELNIESIQELDLDRDPNDPIIRFKEPANCTNIDYRGKCSLKSDDLMRLQELSTEIEDTAELGVVACALFIMLQQDKSKDDAMDYWFDNMDTRFSLDLNSNSSSSGLDNSSRSGSESDSDIEMDNVFNEVNRDCIDTFFKEDGIFEKVQMEQEISLDDDLWYSSIILVFSLIIGCVAEDLHQFLLSVVDISTIRESEWNAVQSSLKKAKTNRSIDDFNESDIRTLTRFKREQLHILKNNFFGEYPKDTYIFKNNKFTFEETLITKRLKLLKLSLHPDLKLHLMV
ncbi:predicted protein [Chaetoceros tenuissimus]|uniref:Uncharacterized protein n=1 Tax=Chaetoceros tenuissimus TaxID=426638 RepID=A0AAD3D448_9STRA|nr:predicted protein [Chaetoceros tenuissimus]